MVYPKSSIKVYWYGKDSVALFVPDLPDLFESDWQSITITNRGKSAVPSAPSATDILLVDIGVQMASDSCKMQQLISKDHTQDG